MNISMPEEFSAITLQRLLKDVCIDYDLKYRYEDSSKILSSRHAIIKDDNIALFDTIHKRIAIIHKILNNSSNNGITIRTLSTNVKVVPITELLNIFNQGICEC